MLKKVFRFLGVFFVSVFVLLIAGSAIVWLNRDKIIEHFKSEVQKQLTTDVHVKSTDVSLLEHFPNITIDLNEVFIKEAIEGSEDTLLFAQRLELSFNIRDILKEKYELKSIHLKKGKVKLFWDENGKDNFTIFKQDSLSIDSTASSFDFALDKIAIEETEVVYINLKIQNEHRFHVVELQSGLSWKDDVLDLGLEGKLNVHQIGLGEDTYFKNKPVELNTHIFFDKEKQDFKANEAELKVENALFKIDGEVNLKDNNYVDVKLDASKSDIQTILSILPKRVYRLVKNYKSKGEVYFSGQVKGVVADGVYPQIDVSFGFENATFYHPESKQEIKNAHLKGSYSNGAKKKLSTSVLKLEDFKGSLSGQQITGNFLYKNFDDPYIEFFLNGSFEAQKLFSFIPESGIEPSSGNLSLNVFFSGMQRHLKSEDGAQHLSTSGQLFMSDFSFTLKDNELPFNDFNGSFLFDKNDLIINGFNGEIGQSDFELSGFFHNVISYLLLEEQTIGVAADFYSDYLNLD